MKTFEKYSAITPRVGGRMDGLEKRRKQKTVIAKRSDENEVVITDQKMKQSGGVKSRHTERMISVKVQRIRKKKKTPRLFSRV